MSSDGVEDLGQLPNGCHLFRQPNAAGGHSYTSDEVSGGIVVWDTSLISHGTLLAAMTEESRRQWGEFYKKRNPKQTTKPHDSTQVHAGDIICLSEDDCVAIDCKNEGRGKYVVEEAEFRGGWFVRARKLTDNGMYDEDGWCVVFHQDSGFNKHLKIVRVVGSMKKTFV